MLNDFSYDGDIDFIAIATSHWHAAGVSVQIRKYNLQNGIIFISPHSKDGFLIDESDFDFPEFCDITVMELDFEFENTVEWIKSHLITLLSLLYSNESSDLYSKIYLISPRNPSFYLIYLASKILDTTVLNIKFILIDEGVGTYFSEERWKKISKLDKNTNNEESLLKHILSSIFKKPINCLKNKLLTGALVDQVYLFDVDGGLVLNEDVAQIYRNVLDGFNYSTSTNIDLLILTQPFVEYDHISEKHLIELIEDVLISNSNKKVNIALKPHPRENKKKYFYLENSYPNVTILPLDVPVEHFFAKARIDSVVGFTSTSLLTASAIYEIPSYTISDALVDKCDSMYLRESISEFRQLSSNHVCSFLNYE